MIVGNDCHKDEFLSQGTGVGVVTAEILYLLPLLKLKNNPNEALLSLHHSREFPSYRR